MLNLEEGLRQIEKRLDELYRRFPPGKWTWAVCYSGGKDSTALLLLLSEFSDKRGFAPIIVHEETTVEIPAVEAITERVLESLAMNGLKVNMLRPSKGFFNIMLERGYGFPLWNRRWCCRMLKYGLAKQWIRSVSGRVLNLLGIRGDEGRRIHGFIRENEELVSALPLIDVTEEWVWAFLKENCPWFEELRRLYPNGSSSLGCWTCTVVSEDPVLKYLDSQLYEMKARLVQARCLSTEVFIELLNRYSKLRPDAFKGYDPRSLEVVKDPSCKGRYCTTCRMKVWRFKGLCGIRYTL
jgi:3'-phosphoadenosine 5'-phosphosulfate sulfotransferase (PAPS reductase)/FAD synthetase